MEIFNSDKIDWSTIFLDHKFIVANYQAKTDCPGCKEMNELFEKLSKDKEFENVKFLWIDSRNNPASHKTHIRRSRKCFLF